MLRAVSVCLALALPVACPEAARAPSAAEREACGAAVVGSQALGKACRADVECVEGLSCVGFGAAKDGACVRPAELGAACGGEVKLGGPRTDMVDFGQHAA